jgi:hypothetical protein
MLEGSTFEFDTRHPQVLTTKIMQVEFDLEFANEKDRELLRCAWSITLDLNYTFAMLKNVTQALALASVELAFRLNGQDNRWVQVFPDPSEHPDEISDADSSNPYQKFKLHWDPVFEVMFDLLDLYISHRTTTFAGGKFSLDRIMKVRIALNEKADRLGIKRHPTWRDDDGKIVSPPYIKQLKFDNGTGDDLLRRGDSSSLPSPETAPSPTSPVTDFEAVPKKQIIAVRRFILQSHEAEEEFKTLDEYFLLGKEEYHTDHEESDGWETVGEDGDGDVVMREVVREERREERRNDWRDERRGERDRVREREREHDGRRDRWR